MKFTRRRLMATSTGVALAGVFGGRVPLAMAAPTAEEHISEFTGGAEITEGKVTLTAPEIAENGNTVPISVAVDSPMSDDDYVESVLIVAEANPSPGVLTLNFTPACGKAEASTRIRLAKTQRIRAIARMSDGSFSSGSSDVKVTIGGCGG